MSDYGTIKARIADEIARADLSTQIAREVKSAIKHYERQRFYFNESTFTFAFQDGRDTYSAGDHSMIARLAIIDEIRLIEDTQTRFVMSPRTYDELRRISTSINIEGTPTDFAYRGQHLLCYPQSDASYAAIVSAVVRFDELSADADTNAWVTDAEELIRQRAKRMLYTNVIRDYEEAAALEQIEAAALRALKSEQFGRNSQRVPIAPSW